MLRRYSLYAVIIAVFVGAPVLVEWATTPPPEEKQIHIETFRYGTSPPIIRANRGDRLRLSFSTRDAGHSFLLQDYRVEAKITPTMEAVAVVDPLQPTEPPEVSSELTLTAGDTGAWWGSLVSSSRFRCHVYCGPMHGFEQGDLIVRPNYLLWGSLGLLASMLAIGWVRARESSTPLAAPAQSPPPIDLNARLPWIGKLLAWRPLQFVGTMPVLAGFTLVVLAGLVGTKVGGRNIAIMMTWAVWMSFLAVLLVPFGTRIWCFVCPLPILGEFVQRGALTDVRHATKHGRYGNKFFTLGWRWPRRLRGPWLRLLFFVVLGSFSASLAGQPRWTAYLLLSLAVMAFLMAIVWEHRAFCRYLCPVASFISVYSAVGRVMVRNRDDEICRTCQGKPCLRGNDKGWACSFGLYVPRITRNIDCGICTECFKSCPHNNISLSWRRGRWAERFSSYGEAWQAIVMLVLAMVYSLTIHSPWPAVRDMANLVDKATWGDFALYAVSIAALALAVVPLLCWLAVGLGNAVARRAKKETGGPVPVFTTANGMMLHSTTGDVFKRTMPALVPLGLGMWAAFFIPVVLTNFTFILYTLSDPFGWGWNLFGAAGMPWIQIWPSGVPWLQTVAVLTGVALSLRKGYQLWLDEKMEKRAALSGFAPTAGLLGLNAAGMLVYFTNF
jgi:polyferredoxin